METEEFIYNSLLYEKSDRHFIRGGTSSSTITNFIFRKLLLLLQTPQRSSTSNMVLGTEKSLFTLDGCGVSPCLAKKQPGPIGLVKQNHHLS